MIVTLFLSWVTVKLFERPILAAIRTRMEKRRWWVTAITVGSVALSSLGVNSAVQARDQDPFGGVFNPTESSAPAKPFESFAQVKRDKPVPPRDGCHLPPRRSEIPSCVYGDADGAKTVLLLGDSHAASWQPALDKAASELGWRLVYSTKSSCRLTFGPFNSSDANCEAWNKNAAELITQVRPDLVVSTSTLTTNDGREVIPRGFLEAWSEFSTHGIDFLMIRDIPHWKSDPVDCVKRFPARASKMCAMKASKRMARDDPTIAIQSRFPNFSFVDFTSAVCPYGICLAVNRNGFTYRDTHHFTKDFSERLFYLFLPKLETN